MRAHRLSPRRGLLAGLVALVLFASIAVAMTTSGAAPPAVSASASVSSRLVVADDGDGDGGRRGHHGRGR